MNSGQLNSVNRSCSHKVIIWSHAIKLLDFRDHNGHAPKNRENYASDKVKGTCGSCILEKVEYFFL